MKKEEFIALAKKYRAGQCSTEEQILYEKIYDKFINEESLVPVWDNQEKENTRKKILSGIEIRRFENKRKSIWLNQIAWRVAASVLLLVGVGLTFYFVGSSEVEVNYLTKSTTAGQRSKVTLSDGSVVTLNSKSKLIYPENFSGDTREITLEGEAFFEVQKDASRTFMVRSGDVVTTVLGTSFNVRAFGAEQVEVTVATGKVKVAANASGKEVLLVKGQQAIYSRTLSDITVRDINLSRYTAWISRSLEFDMMPFSEVIKILERTYNTEIRIRSPRSDDCLIRGKYENEKLINVLSGLKFVVRFDYHVTENDIIMIDGKGCIN
ncbi:FecR domain-containing protein [Fulvivirgaceae bacterium BMA12]|uniref:FecR domain-containing protein n=1 Tax=Agaribacillus aureus TaxID=3051825 RepID=A0ABT8L977_9BACT|nr:FecR domain-containing protein [Fulvivirgaceae bacterium BMA12]